MGINTGDLNVTGVMAHTNSSGAYVNGMNYPVKRMLCSGSVFVGSTTLTSSIFYLPDNSWLQRATAVLTTELSATVACTLYVGLSCSYGRTLPSLPNTNILDGNVLGTDNNKTIHPVGSAFTTNRDYGVTSPQDSLSGTLTTVSTRLGPGFAHSAGRNNFFQTGSQLQFYLIGSPATEFKSGEIAYSLEFLTLSGNC